MRLGFGESCSRRHLHSLHVEDLLEFAIKKREDELTSGKPNVSERRVSLVMKGIIGGAELKKVIS